MKQMTMSARLIRAVPVALGLALAGAGLAQDQAPQTSSTAPLNLPQNPQVFGSPLPSVVKASAIVNGEVITQTDIDQRLALLAIANNAPPLAPTLPVASEVSGLLSLSELADGRQM